MTEKEERIDTIAKIVLSIILIIFDTLALFFIISVIKVDAATMEISWSDLDMPQEYIAGYYSANTGGTQTRSTIGITQGPVYTLGNDKKFMIYTFSNNQLYKFIAFSPYNYAFREGEYYTIKIYLRSQGGYPFGENWGACVGSYSGCVGANRQYGEQYFAQSTSGYLYRPKEGASPDEPEWTRITDVYTYTFVIKAYDTGPWVFYRNNNTYSDTYAFYGYTVEYAGSSFASVTNAIAQQTSTLNTSINNQTTTINNYTQQQNQATQNTIESSTEQQTQDLYGQDLDTADKQGADNTGVNTYNSTESQLNGLMNTSAIDNVSMEFDAESNNWIWNTMTSLMNTNTIVYTMIISILAIGVIKLALAR